MANPDRLLSLLRLFSHRPVVTMDAIVHVCAIPTRTAYRYLNALSEANIPIYFDRKQRGYCLVNTPGSYLENFSVQEAALLISCLRLVQSHMNEVYRQEIDEVLAKLLTRQALALETTQGNLQPTAGKFPSEDYSEALSLMLVQTAIQLKRPVQLSLKGSLTEQDSASCLEFHGPKLQFHEQWLVASADHETDTAVNLRDINHIRIK